MESCYKIIISGRVQGVGYRNFALIKANEYNIKGYVKNTYDNKVEVVCCGKECDVDKFIADLKRGPTFSFVTNIDITKLDAHPDFDGFEIRF
jgi:acylphosphatase